MPRFVILRHQLPLGNLANDHWDLMLQVENHLETWALESEPGLGKTVLGHKLPDHRLIYLDFEGPISGDRGHVVQKFKGDFTWLEPKKTESVLESLVVMLDFPAPGPWKLTISPVLPTSTEHGTDEIPSDRLELEFYFESASSSPAEDSSDGV